MRIAKMLVALALVAITAAAADAQELSRHDQLKIAVQKICPVSGKELGSMGQPIKVKIGQENVFLCCQGCMKGQVNPQHWATIHSNFAKAQGICPVMKHELPANPKWTFIDGQIVYVCCPPCTKKIAADPQGFMQQLDARYLASLQAEPAAR
jgi:hypothetical protein